MISRSDLLTDLQSLLPKIEQDLLERSESQDVPEVPAALRKAFEGAQEAQRTAQNFEDWRTDAITQAAAAWVLSCVFVRFLEDNRLIDPPRISGPGERLKRARDEREIYFKQHPHDRAYLLSVFDDLAKFPGTSGLFGEHNPIRELPNWLSGDAAAELITFFQKIDPKTGLLVHDFTDPDWDTRFLGDLYQDLSEAARKKYALLQTPEFVEEFILDRALDPALEEFGLVTTPIPAERPDDWPLASDLFKMIDPACGSGHFLLGTFRRILARWQAKEPGTNARVLAQRALWSVHGVDVNPFAIAIARFRLLLAALRASGITKLADAPAFEMNLVCGDSLLHGVDEQHSFGWAEVDHVTFAEDRELLRKILRPGTYHCVVANPPYITPKDKALNQAYRERYGSCHRQYSLGVPFMERIFRLAIGDASAPASERKALAAGPLDSMLPFSAGPAGYTGQITANSFMKREFGKKLIEDFLPRIDLTHIIDTSGAYIPGHGTPTVILFGRNRKSLVSTLRTVMGIRGEPSAPDDPSRGLVWTAITRQIDQPDSQSEFVSSADSIRATFAKHPWSIAGGGTSELKERLIEHASQSLAAFCESIGFASFPGQDDAFTSDKPSLLRITKTPKFVKRFVIGDAVRDWAVLPGEYAFTPYNDKHEPIPLDIDSNWYRYLWPMRTVLSGILSFGGRSRAECGDDWWTWYRWVPEKYQSPLAITYAFVATHNHFAFDATGNCFGRSAPVIKLPATATHDDHQGLVGLLNCSVVGFFMRQSAHNMGDSTDESGARTTGDPAFNTFQFNCTQVGNIPLPPSLPTLGTKSLIDLAQAVVAAQPGSVIGRGARNVAQLSKGRSDATQLRDRMVALQEELDWECYRLYGLLEDDLTIAEPTPLELGQRAFEIVMARKMAAGELTTTWFERHGSKPITDLPAHWPDDYRRLVERRIELIETDPNIRLIELPEYKRRWNTEPWDSQLQRALRDWLLGRLEAYFDFDGRMREGEERSEARSQKSECQVPVGMMMSIAKLADIARQDPSFLEVGELYTGDKAFDVQALIQDLVEDESVPLLPILRYKPSGLRKRESWEETWALQRREDSGEQNLKIPVPPKYTSADFLKSSYWRLRGKLDVPKERWASFPHAEGPDGTLSIAWAGYDHLQLAQTISAWYVDIKERHGGSADPRLVPLLAGLLELLPWLKQWHNEIDPTYQQRMGDFFEGFLTEESRELGMTREELKNWQPPVKSKGRAKKAKPVKE